MTTDKQVKTVPLPEEGERIAQEVTGAETVVGGGEWPSPSTPPSGPSPGAGEEPPPAAGGGHGDEPLLKEMLAEDPTAGGSQSVPDAEDDPAAG
ncbi:MAG: hypothetical protein M3P85_00840 [Actinomycetota bacterium]|nr:hypothetical protein [Actinomycetota bacterium]PLS74792.1 MAG: hypothetical protein CYG61_10770 [Actinomycetota bacterium]